MWDIFADPFAKNNVWLTQKTELRNRKARVVTTLTHDSVDRPSLEMATEVEVPKGQQIGQVIEQTELQNIVELVHMLTRGDSPTPSLRAPKV
jgi:hypothetical protein